MPLPLSPTLTLALIVTLAVLLAVVSAVAGALWHRARSVPVLRATLLARDLVERQRGVGDADRPAGAGREGREGPAGRRRPRGCPKARPGPADRGRHTGPGFINTRPDGRCAARSPHGAPTSSPDSRRDPSRPTPSHHVDAPMAPQTTPTGDHGTVDEPSRSPGESSTPGPTLIAVPDLTAAVSGSRPGGGRAGRTVRNLVEQGRPRDDVRRDRPGDGPADRPGRADPRPPSTGPDQPGEALIRHRKSDYSPTLDRAIVAGRFRFRRLVRAPDDDLPDRPRRLSGPSPPARPGHRRLSEPCPRGRAQYHRGDGPGAGRQWVGRPRA